LDTSGKREKTGGRPKLLLPFYQTIADVLEGEIVAGIPPVGQKLLSEAELCERFDAGRHTVREALRVLRDKGLIERTPGRGSVVTSDNPAAWRYTQRVARLSELLRYPEGVRRRHIESATGKLGPDEMALADVKPESRWIRLSGIRELAGSGEPICWFDIYIAPAYARLTKRADVESITLHEEIERCFGVKIDRAQVDMLVTRIPERIAGFLGCEADTPALTTVRRYFASTGDLVQFSIAIHPEKRYTYAMEFVRAD